MLLFLGDDPGESIIRSLSSLAKGSTPVFAVHKGSVISLDFPFPLFKDEKRAVTTAYRLTDEKRSVLFILDPNLRILNTIILSDDVDIKSEVNTVLSEIDRKVDPIGSRFGDPKCTRPPNL